MAEAVETFCFYAGSGEDSVESFAEVDGSGDFAVLIGDIRTCTISAVYTTGRTRWSDRKKQRFQTLHKSAQRGASSLTERPFFYII